MPAPRILVIRGGAIGDFILTLPALRLLRENIPGCQLEVLGYPGIAELAVRAELADATRSLGHRDMALLFVPGAAISDEVTSYLRSFNLVVSYLFDPDGILRDNLKRLGVKTLLECPHRVQPGGGPAAAQLARPLENLAFYLDDPAPRFPDPPDSAGTSEPAAQFILHPGSGSTQKTWPLKRWLAVLEQLALSCPDNALRVIAVTGEAEEERGLLAMLRDFTHPQIALDLWHQLPLPELATRLQHQARAGAKFLGHDSGIGHLAAACGLPCLLLFGPTNPAIWAPQNIGVTALKAPGGDLEKLSVADVLDALQGG